MGQVSRHLLLVAVAIGLPQFSTAKSVYDKIDSDTSESYGVKSQYGPEIAVLNPLFPRDGKLELTFAASYSPLSSLNKYYGFSGALLYHINKRHALEPIWFQYNFAGITSFAESEIRDKLAVSNPGKVDELGIDVPKMIVASSYVFSPFYSKMHITEMSVLHFDFYTAIGAAGVKVEHELLNGKVAEEKWRFGASAAIGMRLLSKSRFGFRFELRDILHPSKNIGETSLTNTMQMTAGFSLFFGAFPDYSGI